MKIEFRHARGRAMVNCVDKMVKFSSLYKGPEVSHHDPAEIVHLCLNSIDLRGPLYHIGLETSLSTGAEGSNNVIFIK